MKHLDQDSVLNYDTFKTPDYFAGARQDWINQLPVGQGLNILELGCGFGETGAYAFEKGVCDTYYGIEIAVSAAAKAQQHLTGVIVGDAADVTLPFKRGQFDALLMSEVLEHLVDPWAVLKRLLPLVKPGGMIFASSPNVAHKDILKELIAGTWDLADAGPKDRTHLRWFTMASYRSMFEELGVTVDSVTPLDPSRTWKQNLLGALTARKFDHLFAYQINLVGRAGDQDPQQKPAKTCVVVSHWVGHPLRQLRSLVRQMGRYPAGAPFDLVVVCNGGGLDAADVPAPPTGVNMRIINRENQGYNIGAWDAGWRAAPGYGHYLFLQDEVVLRRPGWLSAFLERHAHIDGPALIGESMMWAEQDWNELAHITEADFKPAHAGDDWENPVDTYRDMLRDMDIDEGPDPAHLQSLILFTDIDLMSAMDGLPSSCGYRAAVACEIGISRKAASLGATLAQLDPTAKFSAIAHPQWVGWGRFMMLARRRWYRFKAWVKVRVLQLTP